MSRLKLILLVLIVAILSIVFVQNREPLALKILCPEQAQSCLYQTPDLPLAIWMALFIVGGVVTSLLSQLFNRYIYGGAGKRKANYDDFEEDTNKWSMRNDRGDRDSSSERIKDSTIQDKYSPGSYETPQKPEKVERSGSTYSYKYRDATEEPNGKSSTRENNSQKNSTDSKIDSSINLDKDDEDWI